MNNRMTAFTPAWARNSMMQFVFDRFGDDNSIFLKSDIIEDCISQITGFHTLSKEERESIACVIRDAINALLEKNIILVEDVILGVNPDLPEILDGCATCTACRGVGFLQNTCDNA